MELSNIERDLISALQNIRRIQGKPDIIVPNGDVSEAARCHMLLDKCAVPQYGAGGIKLNLYGRLKWAVNNPARLNIGKLSTKERLQRLHT